MPRRQEKKRRRGQRDLSLPYQEWRFEVGAPDHGTRLDAFLAERMEWGSRTRVQRYVAEQAVEVLPHKDPQRAPVAVLKAGLKLRVGQEVVVRLAAPGATRTDHLANVRDQMRGQLRDAEEAAAEAPPPPPLEVVYEDDQLVAVNKPPGVAVHPSHGHLTGSLIHLIHERHRELYGSTEDVPTLCHRLDRETTGLIVAAKDQLSRTRMGRQFEARTVKKAYLALVDGEMEEDEGLIDIPLGKALGSEVRLKIGPRHDADGQHSETAWRVRRRLQGRTLVELFPRTGRQHQLRVHLAEIGHPIVGDKLYFGGDAMFIRQVSGVGLTEDDYAQLGLEHQALHSWKLAFEHPFTGAPMELEAPLWPTIAERAGE